MMGGFMEQYTKLTIEIKRPTNTFSEKYSLKANDSGLDGYVFVDNMVAPLMASVGYAQSTIDDALGRKEDE